MGSNQSGIGASDCKVNRTTSGLYAKKFYLSGSQPNRKRRLISVCLNVAAIVQQTSEESLSITPDHPLANW